MEETARVDASMVGRHEDESMPTFEPEEVMEQDRAARPAPSLAPEHNWTAAAALVRPALRPKGTAGTDGRDVSVRPGSAGPGKQLVKTGPADLALVYVLPGRGFDVVVGVDHLLAWGVGPDEVHAAAISNLGVWSGEAAWVDEMDGRHRVLWSDLGEGMDAARILLEEVRLQLARALGPGRRILIGLPERDLLIAAGLAEGDDEFAALFADYVADRAHSADEPIDDRVFELVDGQLVAL
jgi:hypothetical protein